MPAEFAPARAAIEKNLEKGLAPSVAVAVVQDGRVVWAEGFGFADLDRRTRATSDSIYILASVSKPITATGLMVLADRGRIDLDRPANDYLPGAKLRAHRGRPEDMTLRRLANHTAGLPVHCNFFYGDDRPPSWDETIGRYGFAAWAPGTRWEYSNLAFGILGHITETVSGRPWIAFLEQEVFDPLGMDHTSDRVRPGREDDRTFQYHRTDGRLVRVAPYIFDHPGASVLHSSANDLARFARMHLGDGALGDVRILREETARAMRRPAKADGPESKNGIGWFVGTIHGRPAFWHSGWMPGVSTLVRGFPGERAATIVLTNADERAVTNEVSDALAGILLGEPGKAEAKAPAAGNSPAAAPASSPPAGAPAPPLAGLWEGRMERSPGAIPIRIEQRRAGPAHLFLGGKDLGPMALKVDEEGAWAAQVPCPVPLREGYSGKIDLEFQLTREGDRLTGLCVAIGPETFDLSHWVELTRRAEREF